MSRVRGRISAHNETRKIFALKLCKFCDKGFQHGSSLSRHIKTQHTEEQENGAILCNEEQCQCRFAQFYFIALCLVSRARPLFFLLKSGLARETTLCRC